VKAELYERAGEMAAAALRLEEAEADYQRAIELFEGEGATHPAARVSARIGDVDFQLGNLDLALERMEKALSVLGADEPDADFAALTTQLGRLHFFSGNIERSTEMLEQGLALGEALRLPEVIAQALNSYGVISIWRGRPEMALALYTHSLKLALEHDLPTAAFRAYNNLADCLGQFDRYDDAFECVEDGIALARKVGNRQWEWRLMLESCANLVLLGRWDEALARTGEIDESQPVWPLYWATVAEMLVRRGEVQEAVRLADLHIRSEHAPDLQERAWHAAGSAAVLSAEGKLAEALAAAEKAVDALTVLSPRHEAVKRGFVTALEAAIGLGQFDKADELLGRIDALRPGELSAYLDAQRSHFRARVAAARGRDREVEPAFKSAERLFRGYGVVFWLAVAQAEHGTWLVEQGRAVDAEPLLAEARETFERLGATPYLERLPVVPAAEAAERVVASS
jgi:tetratricopeptide (TPR) repeat protein